MDIRRARLAAILTTCQKLAKHLRRIGRRVLRVLIGLGHQRDRFPATGLGNPRRLPTRLQEPRGKGVPPRLMGSQELDASLFARAPQRRVEAVEADRENRSRALDDLQHITGKGQWPEKIRAEREAAGKPCITINRLPQFVRQVTGDIRKMNPAIKVMASDNKATEDVAQIYEGLIRHIEQRSDASSVYEQTAESAAASSIGWFRVRTDWEREDSFNQEIRIERIRNALSVYCDPKAEAPTREDAEFVFITESMSQDEFAEAYPKAKLMDAEHDGVTDGLEHWQDSGKVVVAEYIWREPVTRTLVLLPDGTTMFDDEGEIPDEFRVRERDVETFKIMWAKISGHEVLEGPEEIPGKYIPLVAVTGEEWHIGTEVYRSSVIRYAKDPQQLYNYFRSTSAEVVTLQPRAPYVGTLNQFKGLGFGTFDAGNALTQGFQIGAQISKARQQNALAQAEMFAGMPLTEQVQYKQQRQLELDRRADVEWQQGQDDRAAAQAAAAANAPMAAAKSQADLDKARADAAKAAAEASKTASDQQIAEASHMGKQMYGAVTQTIAAMQGGDAEAWGRFEQLFGEQLKGAGLDPMQIGPEDAQLVRRVFEGMMEGFDQAYTDRSIAASQQGLIAPGPDPKDTPTSVQEFQFGQENPAYNEWLNAKQKSGATQINMGNGQELPGLSKLGEGMTYLYDENNQIKLDANGAPIAVPIPGTDRAIERAADAKAAEAAKTQKQATVGVVKDEISRARELIQNENMFRPVTGITGSAMSKIDSTDAGALKNRLETIKSNIGFDKLQAMREASPTGGALGAVSEFENRLLQSVFGSLSQAQSAEELLYNLDRLETLYDRIINEGIPDDEARRLLGGGPVTKTPAVNGQQSGEIPMDAFTDEQRAVFEKYSGQN